MRIAPRTAVRGIRYRMTQTSQAGPMGATRCCGYPTWTVPSTAALARAIFVLQSKIRSRVTRPLRMRPAHTSAVVDRTDESWGKAAADIDPPRALDEARRRWTAQRSILA